MLVVPDDISDGQCDDRCDDAEASVSPSPTAGFNERLRCRRADKSRGNIRRSRNCRDKSSILQAGSVGYKNLKDVGHAVETNPVEDLNRSVRAQGQKENGYRLGLHRLLHMSQRSCMPPS